MFQTVNYLFAAYLQTIDGGDHKIANVNKIKPGKAEFFFDISDEEAEGLKLKFHESCCIKFEQIRKNTIDLAY